MFSDPNMMKAAMEQMQRMDPQQMAAIQRMAASNPDLLRQAAAMQGQNLTAEQIRMAADQMKDMTPEQLSQAASQAAGTAGAQQQYQLAASQQLKGEGNRLHAQGKFSQAAEKYQKAESNLEGVSAAGAADLRKACQLNLSSCYLNTGQYGTCVRYCEAVLRVEPGNRKALYRRGQAYLHTLQYRKAERDLKAALDASPEAEKPMMAEKLELARKYLNGGGGPGAASDVAAQEQREDEEGAIEDITPEPLRSSIGGGTSSRGLGSGAQDGMAAALGSEQYSQATEMLKSNPDMVRQAASMVAGMSPETLAAMSAAQGMPISPEMAKMAAQAMSGMDENQIRQMAEQLPAGGPAAARAGVVPSGVGAAPAAGGMPSGGPSSDEMQRLAEQLKSNPESMQQAAAMMKNMQPEQLEAMMRMSGAPAGMKVTPEQMRMASEMMSGMKPEDLEHMTRMAQASGAMPSGTASAPAGFSGFDAAAAMGSAPGGNPDMMADMMKRMEDPAMFQGMQQMLGGMDPKALADMMSQTGMKVSPEQAAQMQGMMKNMTPGQMKMLSRATTMLNRTSGAASAIKRAVLSRWVLILSLLVLILAVLLRSWGVI